MARIPASIRNKNPGAMWGSALAIKWGANPTPEKLNDGTGQNNNIATFRTFTDGISAAQDLWRSSKHYKNKPFKEAIRTWSGGNNVESYIKFVLIDRGLAKLGMTRDTIMNDQFWLSQMGLEFLKAQAWHEAGQKYPATDAEWIEGRRRVFANQPPVKSAAANPQVATANFDPALKAIQTALQGFGYQEIGKLDGLIGAKTKGVLTMFSADRHLSFTLEYPSNELVAEIRQAVAEKWKRPIDVNRAYATEQQVAEKVASVAPAQKAGWWSQLLGWVSTGTATAGGALKLLPDAHDEASPYINIVKEFLPSVPTLVLLAGVAAVAFVMYRQINASKAATVADYQSTKIN